MRRFFTSWHRFRAPSARRGMPLSWRGAGRVSDVLGLACPVRGSMGRGSRAQGPREEGRHRPPPGVNASGRATHPARGRPRRHRRGGPTRGQGRAVLPEWRGVGARERRGVWHQISPWAGGGRTAARSPAASPIYYQQEVSVGVYSSRQSSWRERSTGRRACVAGGVRGQLGRVLERAGEGGRSLTVQTRPARPGSDPQEARLGGRHRGVAPRGGRGGQAKRTHGEEPRGSKCAGGWKKKRANACASPSLSGRGT